MGKSGVHNRNAEGGEVDLDRLAWERARDWRNVQQVRGTKDSDRNVFKDTI